MKRYSYILSDLLSSKSYRTNKKVNLPNFEDFINSVMDFLERTINKNILTDNRKQEVISIIDNRFYELIPEQLELIHTLLNKDFKYEGIEDFLYSFDKYNSYSDNNVFRNIDHNHKNYIYAYLAFKFNKD